MCFLSTPIAGIDIHAIFDKQGIFINFGGMGVPEHNDLVAVLFAQPVAEFFLIPLVCEFPPDFERLVMVRQVFI